MSHSDDHVLLASQPDLPADLAAGPPAPTPANFLPLLQAMGWTHPLQVQVAGTQIDQAPGVLCSNCRRYALRGPGDAGHLLDDGKNSCVDHWHAPPDLSVFEKCTFCTVCPWPGCGQLFTGGLFELRPMAEALKKRLKPNEIGFNAEAHVFGHLDGLGAAESGPYTLARLDEAKVAAWAFFVDRILAGKLIWFLYMPGLSSPSFGFLADTLEAALPAGWSAELNRAELDARPFADSLDWLMPDEVVVRPRNALVALQTLLMLRFAAILSDPAQCQVPQYDGSVVGSFSDQHHRNFAGGLRRMLFREIVERLVRRLPYWERRVVSLIENAGDFVAQDSVIGSAALTALELVHGANPWLIVRDRGYGVTADASAGPRFAGHSDEVDYNVFFSALAGEPTAIYDREPRVAQAPMVPRSVLDILYK